MNANFLIILVVISTCATRLALAQDVQGMSSSPAGRSAVVEQGGQERLKGEVVTVDEASGTLGIKLQGTVGSGDATSPTTFKVQDGLVFNAIKPGDKVSFAAERVGGGMKIVSLTKE